MAATTRKPVGLLLVGSTEVRLWSLPFSIGRSSRNTMTIRDRHLSRCHCEIDLSGDGFEIKSVSTTNPVLVNGKAVERFLLADGDLIEVGEHRFVFRLEGLEGDEPESGEEEESAVQPALSPAAEAAPAPQPEPAPPATAEPPPAPRPDSLRLPGLAARPSGQATWAATVLAGLALFGLLGLGALFAHHTAQTNQQVAGVAAELGGLQQELAALGEEVETARKAYLDQAQQSQQAWDELLAAARKRPAPARRKPAPRPQQPAAGPIPEQRPEPQPAPTAQPKPKPKPQPAKLARTEPPPKPQPKPEPKPKKEPEATRTPKAPKGMTFFGQSIVHKRVAFVLDKSSSMKPVMARLHQEMDSAIDAMTGEHQFNILFYDDQTRFFSRKLVPASSRLKTLAKRFVRRQQASGYTDPLPAIKAALAHPGLEALVLLTDGNINEQEFRFLESLLKAIAGGSRKIRFHLVPVAPNGRTERLLALAAKQKN